MVTEPCWREGGSKNVGAILMSSDPRCTYELSMDDGTKWKPNPFWQTWVGAGGGLGECWRISS